MTIVGWVQAVAAEELSARMTVRWARAAVAAALPATMGIDRIPVAEVAALQGTTIDWAPVAEVVAKPPAPTGRMRLPSVAWRVWPPRTVRIARCPQSSLWRRSDPVALQRAPVPPPPCPNRKRPTVCACVSRLPPRCADSERLSRCADETLPSRVVAVKPSNGRNTRCVRETFRCPSARGAARRAGDPLEIQVGRTGAVAGWAVGGVIGGF